MTEVEVKDVSVGEVLALKSEADKDGITISSEYLYLGAFVEGRLVGFCGYTIAKSSAKLHGAFVLMSHRRKGIYRKMDAVRMARLRSLGLTRVSVTCTRASAPLHLHNGAKIVRETARTVWFRYDKN